MFLARTLLIVVASEDDVEGNVDVAREGIMEEHEKGLGDRRHVDGADALEPERPRTLVRSGDLVVDLSGIKRLDLKSLALLLTAQQQARREEREVWLAGVPARIWQSLNALGLGRFFKPFPASAREVV